MLQPISNLQLATPPATLKLGYAASTGGSTNIHEIRTSGAYKPTDVVATVTDGVAAAPRSQARTWTATVTNAGPNPVESLSVQATTGTDALDDVSWTCTAAGGAICTQESGTGLPDLSEGETPIGGQLTYSITGTPADGTDRATLTIDAQPTGDAGDLVPSNNTVTDRTDLTRISTAARPWSSRPTARWLRPPRRCAVAA